MKTPFRHRVPTDLLENLRWRKRVYRRVLEDPSLIEVLKFACEKDPIFFVNGFCWTYDPRREPFPRIPFVLYEFQEEPFLEILDAINDHDLLIEKSRDMGASWLCLTAFFWQWRFKPLRSFLLGSRTDEYVDASDNPKALFQKLDFLLDNLPFWLKPVGFNPAEHRIKKHLKNPENGSVIDGESTTPNFARGDRRTGILLDEFGAVENGDLILSSTRDATKCRILNSTPSILGVNCAFYEMTQTNIRKIRLHWSMHPLKAAGLYTSDADGRLKVFDPIGFPSDYKPILDGKLRSPWYDNECERAGSPREISREIDIDYPGSGSQYFNPDKIHKAIAAFARPPIMIGDLEYDAITGDFIEFRECHDGPLHLWCMLDGDRNPLSNNKIVIGADVSAGTGASNSCLAGYDSVTLEKVFEYASPYIRPEGFGALSVAVAQWIAKNSGKNPFLVWEANGPGRQFGARVLELGYGNVYLRRNDASIKRRVSDIPGVAPTREVKLALMGSYRAAVEGQRLINRSKRALEETLEYVFTASGSVAHARAADKTDPSGAAANHGDRATADALAWKGLGERKVIPRSKSPEIPVGSLAWRRRMRKEAKRLPNRELPVGW